MTLIHHKKTVRREIIQQTIRRTARRTTVKIPAVILHTAAIPQLLNHLQVITHPLLNALGIQMLPALLKIHHPPGKVQANLLHSRSNTLRRSGEDSRRIDIDGSDFVRSDGDTVHFGAEELNAHDLVGIRKGDIHGVSPDAEAAARQFRIVADILRLHEPLEECVHPQVVAPRDGETVAGEVLRVSQTIQATNHISSAAQQSRDCMEAQAVNLLIDGDILLDIRIGGRDIRLGLVVVVIGDEIPDGVMREESLHLGIELCGERLVVRENKRGPVETGDDIGDGERLARACDPHQRLCGYALPDPLNQSVNRLRLVARGLKRAA